MFYATILVQYLHSGACISIGSNNTPEPNASMAYLLHESELPSCTHQLSMTALPNSFPGLSTVLLKSFKNCFRSIMFTQTASFCDHRFQTQAVANLSIIFFLWSIVSGVLYMFNFGDKSGQELADFLQGNQNFSIKEFTRHNGFYLDNSTLLDCEYFGKPCYPEVLFLVLS